MTEWVLVMVMSYHGSSISTIKLQDKVSCHRVGQRFVGSERQLKSYTCTEVVKEKK